MPELVGILTDGTPPRIWSMLVTIFGDLASEQGARLPGPTLARLTGGMGIRPPAVRTALHRLRREGWIESARTGRVTSHALSASGRAQSLAARARIYGMPATGTLHLVLVAPGAETPDGAVAVMPGLALSGRPVAWSRAIDAPPDWIADRLLSAETMALAAEAERRFAALARAFVPPADPIDAAILRLLVVHLWRRIALRVPALPEAAFPVAWRGGQARTLAHELLRRLPRAEVGAGGAGAAMSRPPPGSGSDQNGESG